MKIAIIETDHFQYGLTQSELFAGADKIFFVTQPIKDEMIRYDEKLCDGEFVVFEKFSNAVDGIIRKCNDEGVDVLLLSPVFYELEAVYKLAKEIKAKKIITIHNLNFWLDSYYRTPRSFKERKLKQKIVAAFDYIAVEDFIYNHVKNNDKKLFEKYRFLYIPFTIFHEQKKTYVKSDSKLKIVLPGYIHKERRRYEGVIEAIRHFAEKKSEIVFSFAGQAVEAYGDWVLSQLDELNKIKPGIVTYFQPFAKGKSSPEEFRREMETADLVLSTSTTEFKALGTVEYIGKTKPTAAIHDMMSFELPGLLPDHLTTPENLKGSVFNYKDTAHLIEIIQSLLDDPAKLKQWKETASINSRFFTADQIKRNLPFFYNTCNRCVMDNIADSNIHFDTNGNCNYCNRYFNASQSKTVTDDKQKRLDALVQNIKKEGKNGKYDCVVGISGGIDSAYVIYQLVQMGIRPIAVHLDNGWNSETATQNIEMLLKKLNVDLFTYVIDWEEFKDIQLAFLKAGVIDIELISDHAITGALMKSTLKFKTKYIILGHNYATESILPTDWYHWKHDALNIRSIHQKFGKGGLKTFPFFNFSNEYYHIKFRKTKIVRLLDYLNYDKAEAHKILVDKFGWKDYGPKHSESIFTRFYQNYILPVKFGVDKRKAHLSSLICSGQMTREKAKLQLEEKPWLLPSTLEDKAYVLKKWNVQEAEFDSWMKQKPVNHLEFKSYLTRHNRIIKNVKSIFSLGRK